MSRYQPIRRSLQFTVLLAFPILLNYFSPVLIMQGSAEGVATFSLFLWSGWLISALWVGRAACGAICPLGSAQAQLDAAIERPLRPVRGLRSAKYLLAVAWVGGIVAAAIYAGGYRQVDLLYQTPYGVSVDSLPTLITYYGVLAVALVPALVWGERGFCHYFCPFSVLNIAGTRLADALRTRLPWPSLRLRADSARCSSCGQCSRACPMSLDVRAMAQRGEMANTECILCGSCVSSCPRGVIRYTWGAAAPRS